MCHSKATAAKTAPSPYRGKKPQQQPRCASTGSNHGQGRGRGKQHHQKKTPKKPPKQKAYEVMFKPPKMVLSEVTVSGERMVKYHIKRRFFQDQVKKVCITGFLALQFMVKWLKAPTLRVSLWRGYTQTLTQTIGLKS